MHPTIWKTRLSTWLSLGALLAAGLAATPPTAPAPAPAPAAPKQQSKAAAALARLRSLAGAWDVEAEISKEKVENKDNHPVIYRVIASDSAVVETLLPGSPMEMETIFHLDGERLICTHYCAAGNQPRMVASTITPEVLEFTFLDATNLANPQAMHMGKLHMEFKDKDHMVNTWTSYENGKETDHAVFKLTRRPVPAPQPSK